MCLCVVIHNYCFVWIFVFYVDSYCPWTMLVSVLWRLILTIIISTLILVYLALYDKTVFVIAHIAGHILQIETYSSVRLLSIKRMRLF